MTHGRKSLYLDYYPPITHPQTGKLTRREFLNLFIYDEQAVEETDYTTEAGNVAKRYQPALNKAGQPKRRKLAEIERQHNKETRQLAENIRAQRQLAVQTGKYGFLDKSSRDMDFLAYFSKKVEEAEQNGKHKLAETLNPVLRHLTEYADGSLTVEGLTEDFCKGFRDYLDSASLFNTVRKTTRTLSRNSAVSYFTVFKVLLNRAVDDKVLTTNPAQRVKRLKREEVQREFLTLTELQTIARTDCDFPTLKRAALLSALTGLRYSDIAKLTWSEVQTDTDVTGQPVHAIRFTQKKTKGAETLPISDIAYSLLGEREAGTDKVFADLLYSDWQNAKLRDWLLKAGITRKVTFHCFRHTFATLQLQQGTDLYTVSKLLGHRDIQTTQIYAKIVNQTKRDAVNRISIEL